MNIPCRSWGATTGSSRRSSAARYSVSSPPVQASQSARRRPVENQHDIDPDECDCGACEPVCPVEAIYCEDGLPERWALHTADNARFFTDTLPGLDAPLSSPGGAAKLGALPADTPLVAGLRPHPMEGQDHA